MPIPTSMNRRPRSFQLVLTVWAMDTAKILVEYEAFLSAENPFPSMFWVHPAVAEIWELPQVALAITSMQAFTVHMHESARE